MHVTPVCTRGPQSPGQQKPASTQGSFGSLHTPCGRKDCVEPIPAVVGLSRYRHIRKKLSFKNLPLAARLRPVALRKAFDRGWIAPSSEHVVARCQSADRR